MRGARFAAWAALSAALLVATPAFALTGVSDVEVGETGSEEAGAFCADFRLSPAEAKMALRKSTKISSADYTHRYDFLPCFVRGTAQWDKTPVRWEFRAGGNGTITKPDGKEIFIGCTWCKANFGKNRDK